MAAIARGLLYFAAGVTLTMAVHKPRSNAGTQRAAWAESLPHRTQTTTTTNFFDALAWR